METITVPKNRVWIGRGFFVSLPGEAEKLAIRKAEHPSVMAGQYILATESEYDGAPFSGSPGELQEFYRGTDGVEIESSPDGRRRFQLLQSGDIVHESGWD